MFGTLSLVAVSGLVTKINAAAVYAGQAKFGSNDEITLQVQTSSDTAEIRLAGPTDRWFGVGFDYNTGDTGNAMTDTYAITVDEQSSTYVATERKLGTGQAGTVLTSTFTATQLGEDVGSGVRRAQLARPLTDANADVYDFTNAAGSINMIYAWGADDTAAAFAQHGDGRGTGTLTLRDTRYFGSADLVPGKSSVKVWLSGAETEEVKIEICSTDGNWAAVGFCGDTACGMEGTYALVKQGDNTKVERILGAAGLATGAGSAVDTEGAAVASDKDGFSCMTYTRECEPELVGDDDDAEEAAVALPCGNQLAFAETGNFQTNLIASVGGTAQWDGQPHIAAQAGIVLDMCIYVDGTATEACDNENLSFSPTLVTSMPSMAPTLVTKAPSMAPTMMTADTPAPTQAESDGSAVSVSSMILFCTMILATALNL